MRITENLWDILRYLIDNYLIDIFHDIITNSEFIPHLSTFLHIYHEIYPQFSTFLHIDHDLSWYLSTFLHIYISWFIMIFIHISPHLSTFIMIVIHISPHLSTFIMIFIHISPHFISSNIINPISISSMALNQGPSRPALWAMEPGQTTMGWDIPMKITGKMAGFHRKITGNSLGNPWKSMEIHFSRLIFPKLNWLRGFSSHVWFPKGSKGQRQAKSRQCIARIGRVAPSLEVLHIF